MHVFADLPMQPPPPLEGGFNFCTLLAPDHTQFTWLHLQWASSVAAIIELCKRYTTICKPHANLVQPSLSIDCFVMTLLTAIANPCCPCACIFPTVTSCLKIFLVFIFVHICLSVKTQNFNFPALWYILY